MKNEYAGGLLKLSAVIAFAIVVRFDVNPLVYLMLGMLFFLGWKMQHMPDLVPVRAPQKRRSVVVAKRI